MNPFWSQIVRELSPYVPGEQPHIPDLVKLNTNAIPSAHRHKRWQRCAPPRPTPCGFIPIPRPRNCARRLPPITA